MFNIYILIAKHKLRMCTSETTKLLQLMLLSRNKVKIKNTNLGSIFCFSDHNVQWVEKIKLIKISFFTS